MLVLTRKTNESIVINDDVEVMIIDVRGDSVKLGINAPHYVTVNRKEVYEEIQAANLDAAKANPDLLKKIKLPFKKKAQESKVNNKVKPKT